MHFVPFPGLGISDAMFVANCISLTISLLGEN